ncbi:glucan 1,4-alpha-glucosidase [Jatrophihabitans sp. GAS493]|uniref:glucodextranase DOMON-like domain-containing protein n=1 Tax=Jatrophihabitans sp. GAS493 TaxID=1907575 RepID=UPI000BC062E8|nr:glucodextranase DOMON-like domain-containing protein [Jatrophihabitans sp. GAS493]SOD74562.1 glucan 1,4-alpha-glucosidase [Jatrophihabitans sp. GAS493]
MPRSRRLLAGAVPLVFTAALLVAAAPSATAASPAAAPNGPGTSSHQSLARKDCVGTARNTASKVWFTVANGVLSDVYAPTVDTTQVETMQYLVTDGKTFTDLQTRDMTYRAVADPTGMLCTVTATAKSGAYRLITNYFTDPARSSVVVHTSYLPLTTAARGNHVYVRLDANAGGTGGGGSTNVGGDSALIDTSTATAVPVSYDTQSQTGHAYATPSYLALRGNLPFTSVSSGFVGTSSDGLTELDASHTLSPRYTTATNGNIEQTAGVQTDSSGAFTLALGFGSSRVAAVGAATATAHASVNAVAASYELGWLGYDAGLRVPSAIVPGLSTTQLITAFKDYYQSANVVKASEDKTYPGAIVAGLDAPWGQSIAGFSTGYREVFGRDLYEAWTALYTDGDLATAQATVRYLLLKSQLPDGSQPRNSTLDGAKAPDSFNIQLDEAAYPLLMALQSGLASDNVLWPHVRATANFLISHGPSFGVERWEEQTGYSPSTIAAEIAGLVAAASIAKVHGDAADARIWLATADQYQRSIKSWGVTSTGSLSSQPYFIRLSKTGDPNAAISYGLGNGGPTLDQRNVVDLGFLEYVRLGELSPTDPTLSNSLAVADANLKKSTSSGPGWLRYNGDGYGDCYVPSDTSCTVNGAPWTNNFSGTGHPWPVLGAERAQQYLAQGNRTAAASILATINKMNSGPGLVPEQVWDKPNLPASPYGSDPATASIGFVNGQADGSASPLSWGSAAQVRLTADLVAGRNLELPTQTKARYVSHQQLGTTLQVDSPLDATAVDKTITVSGTAVAGATIDVAEIATDANNATITAKATAKLDGSFSLSLTAAAGTNVLVISSTAPNGGTAQVVRSVINDAVNGTLLFEQADPTGDDNGPGNYAYPTAGDFHAGAFDLTNFQVYDTGSTVTFRVQTRDLTATFGSTNGAQLDDVYVHVPGAAATSTSPSYPGMNYQLAPAAAWSRLIEAQGFGNQRFVDSSGATLGDVTTSANSISRYVTFSVDKAALGGTPGSGWGFTVVLTGQDGTHGTDQTRGFSSTPGGYNFGVCATAEATPICSADPNTVPKAVDVLTPTGTAQSDELNYVLHTPVVLQDITIP